MYYFSSSNIIYKLLPSSRKLIKYYTRKLYVKFVLK